MKRFDTQRFYVSAQQQMLLALVAGGILAAHLLLESAALCNSSYRLRHYRWG